MELNSKVLRVTTTKALFSGTEEEIGVVSRVFDGNRIRVTVPITVANKGSLLLLQNSSNFKRSSEPERFMRYVDGSWVDVEEDVLEVVKSGFLRGVSTIEAQIGGSRLLFDLQRMIELNRETGKFQSIAWIDVKGKCFFPKSFVSSDDDDNGLIDLGLDLENEGRNENPRLEIEIKINGNNSNDNEAKPVKINLNGDDLKSNKRKIEGLGNDVSEGSSNSAAKKKKKQVEEGEFVSPRWPRTRMVGEHQERYRRLKDLFLKGLDAVEAGAARITAIHQSVRREKAEFDAFMKQVEFFRNTRGTPNLAMAWFGTTAKGVEMVMAHGFGALRLTPGAGLYLSSSRSIRMSSMMAQVDENGEKHIILCRVILGKCEKIEAGNLQSSLPRMNFDTGMDDLKEPRWYALCGAYIHTRILPECVFSFKCAAIVPGQVYGVSSLNFNPSAVFSKLVSKLRDSLPPPKVHALLTLHCSVKDGKLGKDGFLRELRSIVGDEVLRSTIQEIRG